MPQLKTLNVKPETREAIMSLKGNDGIHNADEAIQHLLNKASAFERVMSYLRSHNSKLFDHLRWKVLSNAD